MKSGNMVLRSSHSRIGGLIALVFLCLFWNGVTCGFLLNQVIRGWLYENGSVFLTLFSIPFVLGGLFMIGAVFHAFLGLANPRPVIRVDSSRIALGDTVPIKWEFSGKADRIERLVIYIEGREETTYREGTDTHTDTEVFVRLDIVDTTDPGIVWSGEASVTIPKHMMPSFKAGNNKIVWRLCVDGKIERWPDVKEEFEITVFPYSKEALPGGVS